MGSGSVWVKCWVKCRWYAKFACFTESAMSLPSAKTLVQLTMQNRLSLIRFSKFNCFRVFFAFCSFVLVLMLIPCTRLLVYCVFVAWFLFATSECVRDFAKQNNSYIYVTCQLFLKSSFITCNIWYRSLISVLWLIPWICLTIDGSYLLRNLKNARCRDRYEYDINNISNLCDVMIFRICLCWPKSGFWSCFMNLHDCLRQ